MPPKIVALIEKMMAKKPEDRLQSATEVVEEIRQVVGSESGAAPVGGETMILRRYAKGGPAAASVPTPASLTTGSRTPGGENTTPGEGNDHFQDVRVKLMNRALVAGIVVAGLAFVAYICSKVFAGPPRPRRAAPAATVNQQPAPSPVPVAVDPPPDRNLVDQDRFEKALTALDLEMEGAKPDTDKLRQEFDKITNESLNADNLAHAKKTNARLEELVAARRTEQIQGEFDQLSDDISKLCANHDYDTALSRMDAFGARAQPAIKGAFDRLRADTQKAKDDFHTEMEGRIAEANALGSEERLKDLRDSKLPRSYLGSDLEREITKDINDLETKRQGEMDDMLKHGKQLLAEWRFDEFESDFASNRAHKDGEAANRYYAYHDAVAKVHRDEQGAREASWRPRSSASYGTPAHDQRTGPDRCQPRGGRQPERPDRRAHQPAMVDALYPGGGSGAGAGARQGRRDAVHALGQAALRPQAGTCAGQARQVAALDGGPRGEVQGRTRAEPPPGPRPAAPRQHPGCRPGQRAGAPG